MLRVKKEKVGQKMITKEYVLSIDELKQKFPIGSLQTVEGKLCIVKRYGLPQATTYGASYPKVVFDEVEKEDPR